MVCTVYVSAIGALLLTCIVEVVGWNYLVIPKPQRLHRWSLGMGKSFHPTFYNGCDYLSLLGLKLNHVSKRGHWGSWYKRNKTTHIKTCTYFMVIYCIRVYDRYTYPHSEKITRLVCVSDVKCQVTVSSNIEDTRHVALYKQNLIWVELGPLGANFTTTLQLDIWVGRSMHNHSTNQELRLCEGPLWVQQVNTLVPEKNWRHFQMT